MIKNYALKFCTNIRELVIVDVHKQVTAMYLKSVQKLILFFSRNPKQKCSLYHMRRIPRKANNIGIKLLHENFATLFHCFVHIIYVQGSSLAIENGDPNLLELTAADEE